MHVGVNGVREHVCKAEHVRLCAGVWSGVCTHVCVRLRVSGGCACSGSAAFCAPREQGERARVCTQLDVHAPTRLL